MKAEIGDIEVDGVVTITFSKIIIDDVDLDLIEEGLKIWIEPGEG